MKKPKLRKLPKVERVARVLHQRVAHDRSKAAAIERERHLRALMGLPSREASP
jgi:uncharacterized protein YaiL (DUF2058 family)